MTGQVDFCPGIKRAEKQMCAWPYDGNNFSQKQGKKIRASSHCSLI